MKRQRKQPGPGDNIGPLTAETGAILQIKVWLMEIGPMGWRRVLVPATITLRELHGVFQVAMGCAQACRGAGRPT
jgi:Plasmid pRiA4b ORF-3-like protein